MGRSGTVRAGRRTPRESLAIIGRLYAVFTGLMVSILPGAWIFAGPHRRLWAVPGWAALLSLELLTTRAAWEATDDGFDAVSAAFRLSHWLRRRAAIRPVVAVWYAAHFAAAAAVAIAVESVVAGTVERVPKVVALLVFVGVGLTVVCSANLYGLLALTSLGPSERLVRGLWRWRVAVDLGVAIVAVLLPVPHLASNARAATRLTHRQVSPTRPAPPAAAGTPRP